MNGFGLLHDFFHHEVAITAFGSGGGVHVDVDEFSFDLFLVDVIEGNATRAGDGDFFVADIVDVVGVFDDGGNVGGDEGFAFFDADDHRGVFAGEIDATWVALEHDREGIRAADAEHGVGDGMQRPQLVFIQIVFN